MNLVFLIGEPLVGKSTILKRFLAETGQWDYVKLKKCKLMVNSPRKIFCIGHYSEELTFGGTDTLAMDAIADCERFVKKAVKSKKCKGVILEGDRLLNKRFLDFCKAHLSVTIIKVTASDSLKTERELLRGSNQDEKFKKGRKTKVDNICKDYSFKEMPNESEEDLMAIVNHARFLLKCDKEIKLK